MVAYRNNGPFTMTAGEALVADRFVLISSSTAMYADAGEEPIGLTADIAANAAEVPIHALTGVPSKVTASKAITAGSAIYVTTDGKVSDAAVGKQIGIALTAASADGGVITAIVWGPRGGQDQLSARGQFMDFFDDFFAYDATATVGNWAVVEDAGATAPDAITDAEGGVLRVGCDGDDNDECYVSSIAESWLFTTTKNLWFEARVSLTEAATDDANWIIGLSDTVGADSLLDDGAGPMASYDGAVFYKIDGTMQIGFETSNAGTQVTNGNVNAFVSGTWYRLSFSYDFNDGVTATITPYVDGVAGTAHELTIAGMAEMHVVAGVKAGGANEEAFLVDYIHVAADR